MDFIIERSHIIFKHLIHVGPEIDADAVADFAVRKDYQKSTRNLKTPKGILKEYLFRPKTNPQSLIVFSSKGFVIDAQPSEAVLPLFRDAYDFYEKVMGDTSMTATVVMDIKGIFEVFSPEPVESFIGKFFDKPSSEFKLGNYQLSPHGFILGFGSGKFPEESIQLTLQPLPKDQERRLLLNVVYRSTQLDDALKFIETISDNLKKTLTKIAKK
ncbi:hypothetical protein EU523_01740 [Candidatus Heimdallarchaeota archaeon]|jgi:hypothetical protein|nr:MAG: hypothetical protein EU523_01740 [Candidatus Heimdallarchaeota archaeon]